MTNQKTISKEIMFAGVGLHTGNLTTVKLKPAAANSGIVFIRKDINEGFVIPVSYKNVLGLARGTTIGIGNVAVCTVEHILSALNGLQIDNIQIELDDNEPPVFDGSANFFVKLLIEAGITEQQVQKNYLIIKEPVIYKSNTTEIAAYPSNELSIDCTIVYDHPLVSKQQISIKITPETFIRELSPARTYCFDFEIESLKKYGLAKGGGLENTIIIGINDIYNNEKLRFQDEFVRHKVLDLLGDIYLLGRPIIAHIVAVRSGHRHNINFVKKIVEITGG
jgi:UDP-3-O-acyl N-acetylglucosamine deacetylase